MIERIKQEVPNSPGCYIYYNKDNKIIYIGKAKNLKKRMTSYFNRVHNIKTTKLVSEIVNFKYIVTNNERESLILERNLIKEHMPRYNIMLKDDKQYPYIVITNEQHPRILKVRDRKFKGTYFGPYPSASFVNDIIKVIGRETNLRKCQTLPKEVCVYYHLKQCYGPCIKEFSKEEVKVYKDEVSKLLKNNMKGLERLVEGKMKYYASILDFENAQELKVVLNQIEQFSGRQAIDLDHGKSFDVIEVYKDDNWVSIAIINVVNGIVYNINTSVHSYIDDYISQVISYLYQYYDDKLPELFLTSDLDLGSTIENVLLIEQINSHLLEYRNLEVMGIDNAREYYKNNVDKLTKLILDDSKSGYEELKVLANSDLDIIEMYDMSHMGGDAHVGVKVSYKNGKKDHKAYRKYKVREAKAGDEYGSMREVLTRRFSRMIQDNEVYPDLVILDGGKGQINVCLDVLNSLSIADEIAVIGLVKDDKHTTKALMNKNLESIPLKKSTKLYKFLFNIQEEVHRFAINYHHKSKENQMIISKLDTIEGLGPKRKQLLIQEFKDINGIKSASDKQLRDLKIPKKVIDNIKNNL